MRIVWLWLLCSAVTVAADTVPVPQFQENDIQCLLTTHSQFNDPEHNLSTWKFNNMTRGFTCNFEGIQCWHVDDDKVLSIKLPGMGLTGSFPDGVKYCGSMTALNLSDNILSGPIPPELCKWLPFLVYLDLSGNQFTGPIPPELYNCTYLNNLHLNDNQLTGTVPWQLARLQRLKDFNVSNNDLSGPIPTGLVRFGRSAFENNSKLCGSPLNECTTKSVSSGIVSLGIVVGCTVGGVVLVCVLGFALWRFFIRHSPK